MISFVLLFAVAFAQLPTEKAACETANGTWNEASTPKCTCTKPGFLLIENNKCVGNCSEGGVAVNGTCKKCKENDKNDKYYNGTCVEKCPEGYGPFEWNICKKCSEQQNMKYYKNGECTNSCGELYYVADNTTCKKCSEHPTDKLYDSFTEKCVKDCPATMKAGSGTFAGYCVCKDDTPIADATAKKCVAQCPDGKFDIKNSNGARSCGTCPSVAVYVPSKKECDDRCPDGYTTDDKQVCHKNCVNEDVNKFTYNNTCVKECPTLYGAYTRNICKKCSEINTHPLYDEKAKTCVEKCPEGTAAKDGICKSCKDDATNKFIYNGTCVKECPSLYAPDANNTCKKCSDDATNKLYDPLNKKCVKDCLDPMEKGSGNNTNSCACKAEHFADSVNKKCVKECPAKYEKKTESNGNRVCAKCEGTAALYNNETKKCVPACPEGSVPKEGICQKCKDDATNKYYNNGVCVKECNQLYGPDANNVCKKCSDDATNKLYDPLNMKCVKDCPDAMEKGTGRYEGFCACKAEHFADSVNKKCVKECPAKYEKKTESSGDRLCVKCEGTTAKYNEATKKCVASCPSGTTEKDGICKSNNGVNGLFLVLAMALFFLF